MATLDKAIGNVFLVTAIRGGGLGMTLVLTALQAAAFGTSAAADAFFFARQMLASTGSLLEDWLKAILVPLFVQRAKGRVRPLRSPLGAGLVVASVALGAAGWSAAPSAVPVLAPGFEGERLSTAIEVFRILSLGLAVSFLGSYFAAIHFARRRFGLSTLATLLPRMAGIVGFATVGLGLGVTGFAWWLAGGMTAMAALLALSAMRADETGTRTRAPAARTGRRILAVSLVMGSQMALGWSNAVVASLGAAGTVALMFLGLRLLNAAPGMANSAVHAVFYTEYADAAGGARSESALMIASGLRMSFFFVLPVAGFLLWGADPLITLLLERGAFSAADGAAMAVFVTVMIPSLVVNAVQGTLTAALLADMDLPALRTALVAGVAAIGVRLGLGIPLVQSMGLTGLGVAILCSTVVGLVAYYVPIRLTRGRLFLRADWWAVARLCLAVAAAAIVAAVLADLPFVLRAILYAVSFAVAGLLFRVPEAHALAGRIPLLRRAARRPA